MKRIVQAILSFYLNAKKINKNSFLIIETSFPAGSNTMKIYDQIKEEYEVDMIYDNELRVNEKTFSGYFNYIKNISRVAKYNYIICTHGHYKQNHKQILIDLWHGIPIKSMMYMEADKSIYKKEGYNPDYLVTSSKMESTLMAACTHITYDKHRVLGSPRNDYLIDEKEELAEFDFIKNYKNVVFYVPTYRQGYLNRTEGKPSTHLFHFDKFEEEEFIDYLKTNNILLMIKYHPFEDSKKSQYGLEDNIYHLNNQELIDKKLDLYELLPHIDLLITDYSSIYFDYLLLDKPIVFTPVDLKEYSKDRGLLLEPYDFWTPGPKCFNQESLQEEILKSLEKQTYFSRERKEIRNIFHRHQDGKSTDRVVQLIKEVVEKDY